MRYPHIRLIESEDTALSAKKISEGNLKGIAAIALHLQPKCIIWRYAKILKPITNYTRFLIVGPRDEEEGARLLSTGASIRPLCFLTATRRG